MFTNICMHIHAHGNIHEHTYMHAKTYIHTYKNIYIHTYMYIHTYISVSQQNESLRYDWPSDFKFLLDILINPAKLYQD